MDASDQAPIVTKARGSAAWIAAACRPMNRSTWGRWCGGLECASRRATRCDPDGGERSLAAFPSPPPLVALHAHHWCHSAATIERFSGIARSGTVSWAHLSHRDRRTSPTLGLLLPAGACA
eukprot:scaffold3717_cov124-Isochrysis_galbana.AAC.6